MDSWKTIDKSYFIKGETYTFRYKDQLKDKVYVGENEVGILMFEHVDEARTSFVTPTKVLKELFITKK